MPSLFPRLFIDLIQNNRGLGKVAFFPTKSNMSTLLKSSFSQWKLCSKDSPLIQSLLCLFASKIPYHVYMLETLLVIGSTAVCSDCPFRSGQLGSGRVIYLKVFYA